MTLVQVLDVGSSYNHLYKLSRPDGSNAADLAGTALGKLEMKWRGSMGEVGRLQTQQIFGAPAPAKVPSTVTKPSFKLLAICSMQSA